MLRLRFAIRPWTDMDVRVAHQWIDGVRPAVKAMLSPDIHERVDAVSIELRDARESPYGVYLGSWIEDRPRGPIIYSQANWATPLALMFLDTPQWLTDHGPPVCRTRMQMGVTNDVWQPFVINPPVYSMVRHHALMLTAAWCWLADDDRQLWLNIITDQLEAARQRFYESDDIVTTCAQVEHRARLLWHSRVGALVESARIMADYYLACTIGIASLVRWLVKVPPVRHGQVLRRWSCDHERSDFNEDHMRDLWRSLNTGGTWLGS